MSKPYPGLRPGFLLLAAGACAISLLACSTDSETEMADPALERGRYLAENVVTCVQCHSEHDWTVLGSPPTEPRFAGQDCPVRDENPAARDQPGAFLSKLCTPNITSDPETGIGGWTRAEIARAFRDGVARDGTPLFPIMWLNLHAISDEDADAIAAFIQTLAPVVHEQPGRGQAISTEMHNAVLERLPASPRTSPSRSDEAAYGRYLGEIARCRFCHTPRDAPGQSQPEKEWTGGARYRPPGAVIYSTNLTTHPEGIGDMTRDEFITLFRERGGRVPVEPEANTVMPWVGFAGMTDEDLGAIWAFLQTLPPRPTSVSPEYEM